MSHLARDHEEENGEDEAVEKYQDAQDQHVP
jgi:hypothetical protein